MPDPHSFLEGKYVYLQRVTVSKHSIDLYNNLNYPEVWEFFYQNQCTSMSKFMNYVGWLERSSVKNYAICQRKTGQALGFLGYMPADSGHTKAFEVVNVMFSSKLQRTTKATQAFYLIAKHCFQGLSCKTLQWRCDLKNQKSDNAARRFGFYYDGIKPDGARYYKQFYMIQPEWNNIKSQYDRWLDRGNFDAFGNQLTRLEIKTSSF